MLYIDNIRILLISLIVLLHLAITYGAPGGWYYNEMKFEELDLFSTVIYTLYNATVQAFSLGFFFMISAYFTAASYDRNGARKLLASRFLRLGIPLLFQIIVIQPVLVNTLWGTGKPFLTFYVDYFTHLRTPGVGPLWFIEALLIFSVIYVICRLATEPHNTQIHRERALPGNFTIALFALTVGLISFIVRLWLPVGWNFRPLNFQFAYFTQYI